MYAYILYIMFQSQMLLTVQISYSPLYYGLRQLLHIICSKNTEACMWQGPG